MADKTAWVAIIGTIFLAFASVVIPASIWQAEKRNEQEKAIWSACAQTRGYNSYQECITFVRHGLRIGAIETTHEIEGVVNVWLNPEEYIETPEDFDPYNDGCDKYAT